MSTNRTARSRPFLALAFGALALLTGAAPAAAAPALVTMADAAPTPWSPGTADAALAATGLTGGATVGQRAGTWSPPLALAARAGSAGAAASMGAAASISTAASVTYVAPIDPPEVTRPFDGPAQPWLPGHRGADLAAAPGDAVHAAAGGVVAFAGTVAGKPVVSIDHPDGIRTTYEPVAATVTTGQSIQAGAVIGTLTTGHGRDDLHWGARRDAGPRPTYLDPMSLRGSAVVIRLYPTR